jgi:hypothetical protein
VPAELPSVHTDGYERPFRYEASDGKTILLYSCGRDGEDNHGDQENDVTWQVPARFVPEEAGDQTSRPVIRLKRRAPAPGQQGR